jgi:hypothetical protein
MELKKYVTYLSSHCSHYTAWLVIACLSLNRLFLKSSSVQCRINTRPIARIRGLIISRTLNVRFKKGNIRQISSLHATMAHGRTGSNTETYLRVLWFCPAGNIPPMLHTVSTVTESMYVCNLSKWRGASVTHFFSVFHRWYQSLVQDSVLTR